MVFKNEIRGRGANDGNARYGQDFPAPLRSLGLPAADGEQVEVVFRAQAHIPQALAHPDARHGNWLASCLEATRDKLMRAYTFIWLKMCSCTGLMTRA